MARKKKVNESLPIEEVKPVEEVKSVEEVAANSIEPKATNIWLQFNTLSVGYDEEGKPTASFDLVTLLRGLQKLGDLVIINEQKEAEMNAEEEKSTSTKKSARKSSK